MAYFEGGIICLCRNREHSMEYPLSHVASFREGGGFQCVFCGSRGVGLLRSSIYVFDSGL